MREVITVNMNEMGERLISARGNRSIESVSEETGISIGSLEAYEAGKRIPSDIKKIKIAKIYGTDMKTLFFT